MILLDTDTCVEILRGNPRVLKRRDEHRAEETAICFMTAAELYYGAEFSNRPEENRRLVEGFLLSIAVIGSEASILKAFGSLKAALKRNGALLPDADILIAAATLEKARFLVTGNVKHFERVDGLRTMNWIR
jgi:tRNA(fMet)-specific endonuclease VapC